MFGVIIIIIVSVFLLEKEAQSKELSMSIQLGGGVMNMTRIIIVESVR